MQIQKKRSCQDVIKYIDDRTFNALKRPAMFTGSLVELEGLFRSFENMRNYCLGIEDQNIAAYTEFIQTQKDCTCQGFVLTHSNKTNSETIDSRHEDKALHKAFVKCWTEFIEWRDQRYQAAGIVQNDKNS